MEMDSSLTKENLNKKQVKDPGFFRELWQQVRLVFYLLRDPDVPFYLKFLPFLSVVYLLWPLDFVTDIAPVLGQLDDFAILLAGFKIFIELAPPDVVARHLDTIRVKDGFAPLAESEAESPKIIIDPDPAPSQGKKEDQA